MAYSLYSCYGQRLLKNQKWILLSARETVTVTGVVHLGMKGPTKFPGTDQLSCQAAIFQMSQDILYSSTLHLKHHSTFSLKIPQDKS